MLKRSQSDFLFAQPSFLSGAACALDLLGIFDEYNRSGNPDVVAIAADRCVIGDDMLAVLEQEGATR